MNSYKNIVVTLVKLIYRYLYKYYLLIVSIFLSIIIILIILEIFIQYFFNKDNVNVIKNFIYKNRLSCQISYILEKKFDLNRLWNPMLIYNYALSSSYNKLFETVKNYCNYSNNPYQLIQKYFILNYIKSKKILSCLILEQKKIKYLILVPSSKEIHIYHNIDSSFTKGIIKILKKSNDELFYTILFIGELNDTFINSARNLGLEKNCIEDIVNALQYQLDFRKLRKGDRFSVLVSSYKINGDNQLQNRLIGARLNSSGKDYYVFRANNGKFYNREAIRLGNNFIRLPLLQPYRISSNFNLNRLNPVTGLISPHPGVDFAVPIGTPVLSIGDGEVVVSKYSKVAGNYVGIKHDYQCMTKYMHLKKVLVKQGQKVKQGQQIALSGNTGRSTGPHLHFELWINHHPVNPLTTSVLNTEKLLGSERIKYLHQINEIVPKLRFD